MVFAGNIFAALAVATFLVALYFKWSYQYWNRRGVPSIEPSFPYGNIKGVSDVKEPEYMAVYRCYEELRARGLKHGGIYSMTRPLYVPIDAEYVRNILISDFQHFYDRSVYFNQKHDPLGANLLTLEGRKWREMRTKLTPAFTSVKMKTMMRTMLLCAAQMKDALDSLDEGQFVDVKEITACYATDIIGSCAFGIDCNSFREPQSEFRRYFRGIADVDLLRRLQRLLTTSFPNFSRLIGLPSLNRDLSKFFMGVTRSIVNERKKNGVRRDDILHILMNVHHEFEGKTGGLSGSELEEARKPLTMEEIAANSFVFFLGGFETSSVTLSFAFYELSVNQAIQDRVRREITSVLAKGDGAITYESLFEMKYTRQVLDETLRKYPVLPVFKRKCTKEYQVPGSDVVLEKGTSVFVSVFGMHRNPDNFPQPDEFDPERFNERNKGSIAAGSYLGFGDGPRNCIGKRFGLMQMTIALVTLLKAYRFTLSPKTQVPLELNPKTFIVSPKGGVWVCLEKL